MTFINLLFYNMIGENNFFQRFTRCVMLSKQSSSAYAVKPSFESSFNFHIGIEIINKYIFYGFI